MSAELDERQADLLDALERLDAGARAAVYAGQFPQNSTSVAYEAVRIVKAAAGTLYGFSGYSSRTSAQFIQVFDAKSAPTSGDAPVIVIAVPAASNFSYNATVGAHGLAQFMGGRRFQRGIVIACSTTGQTYTATAANETWLDVQFV